MNMPNGNDKLRKKDSARLVWDTKPRRAANPKDIEFQTAEVVIPNPQSAGELPLSFRDGLFGEQEIDKQKMNRLIWGDNLLAMQALLSQGYEGKIDLIYIDPPFDSKADYSHKMQVGDSEVTKEPSVIERLAYKDTWAGGTDSYLDMLYPRLQLMKRLLSQVGTIYVHLDWHVVHYAKVMLDEIFGKDNFLAEVVWKRADSHNDAKTYSVVDDRLLVYVKSDQRIFNMQFTPLSKEVVDSWYSYRDENGRPYKLQDTTAPGGRGPVYNWKGVTRAWRYTRESMEKLEREGRLYHTKSGYPKKIVYLEESKGVPLNTIWSDIRPINRTSNERTEYDTQKPELLLERIINVSSDPGSLVADFFSGSGTSGLVADKLGRRWIMCELGKVGIQVTRARQVEQRSTPFIIENIGNYQREMIYLTGGRIWEMQQLILKLYGATPRDKDSGLGTRKTDAGTELVFVGYPDRPVTAKKAEELAALAQKLDGTGYARLVILGWDYEYNFRQSLEARLAALKGKVHVKVESRDIPPDIYDYLKKAKSEEDIESLSEKVHFYERPYLRLSKPTIKKADGNRIQVTLDIKRYVLMDIPVSRSSQKGLADYEALMKLAKDNFAVLIDYWAVDWDYDGYTFKSQWQALRGNGRKAKTVPIEAIETLDNKKKRTIAVRVVDIFGNDAGVIIEL